MSHQCAYPVDAVADAWASIDGKVDAYRAGRNAPSIMDEPGGHFSGYQADAQELIERIANRGFVLVPVASASQPQAPSSKLVTERNVGGFGSSRGVAHVARAM